METRIKFLDQPELEKLLNQPYPDDSWGPIELTLYLTAAMTGLRQGELLGLRWRDIDLAARKVRGVVSPYVRGTCGCGPAIRALAAHESRRLRLRRPRSDRMQMTPGRRRFVVACQMKFAVHKLLERHLTQAGNALQPFELCPREPDLDEMSRA